MNDQVKRIEEKVQQLLKKYQLLQKENEKLNKENEKLKSQLQNIYEDKNNLLQQVDVLKMNVASWDETAKKDLEKHINIYLKDIEKCLALLHT